LPTAAPTNFEFARTQKIFTAKVYTTVGKISTLIIDLC